MRNRLWLVTKFGEDHIDGFLKSLPKGEHVETIDQKTSGWSLGRAWNAGLDELARYKTVIISNDDVRVKEETGMRLCKILDRVGRPTKTLIVSAYDINLHKGDFGNVWIPSDVMKPQSFLFAVDERLPEVVGRFDERFTPYLFEDSDMFHRIKMAGYDWSTAVPVWHRGAGSTPTVDSVNQRNMYFEYNKKKYVEKWGGEPGFEKWSEVSEG